MTWGTPSGSTLIGTFSGYQTVTLTADFTNMSAGIAGSEYTSDPSVPGRPDNTNPPFQRIVSGTLGTTLNPGDQV
ncbi:MAG: hypothetical protein AB1499_18715, partial [Nitrospirota bacterium]